MMTRPGVSGAPPSAAVTTTLVPDALTYDDPPPPPHPQTDGVYVYVCVCVGGGGSVTHTEEWERPFMGPPKHGMACDGKAVVVVLVVMVLLSVGWGAGACEKHATVKAPCRCLQ
jgi:hypothetical protein